MNNLLSEQDTTAIQDIIMNQLSVQRDQVTPEAKLVADLGADSLDLIEISMAVEEHFNITIPDDELERLETVGDVYEEISQLLQPRSRVS